MISSNHYQEWLDSCVAPEIIDANVESPNGNFAYEAVIGEALESLGGDSNQYVTNPVKKLLDKYEHISEGGWFVTGLDPFNNWERMRWGQFKPDHPRPDPNKPGKKIKYETPPRTEARAIFLENPEAPEFWAKVLDDVSKPIFILEGAKKAGCLITIGHAAIALPGIWMGRRKDPEQLIPELELFAQEGREVVFAFDSDENPKTRRNVAKAIQATARLFEAEGCLVKKAKWSSSLGKGIDDVAFAHGIEKVEEILEASVSALGPIIPVKVNPETGARKLPPQSATAHTLARFYENQMVWNPETESFFMYGVKQDGIWSRLHEREVRSLVIQAIKAVNMQFSYSASYVSGVVQIMGDELYDQGLSTHKVKTQGFLPMKNGVLSLKTLKLFPYLADYYFDWQIPYSFDPSASCEPIVTWLQESLGGDQELVQLHRAFARAILLGRADLHKFLEMVGPGGTGKSTFIRLLVALVGAENVHSTTLDQLEGNRFETASLYAKRLVVITDSDRYGGGVSTLKAISGGDPIRFEEKHKQPSEPFTYMGMVVIAANQPIQSQDYTSGLGRRRITAHWNNVVPDGKRRNLISTNAHRIEGEFAPYLPGFLNWVLEMPDEVMEHYLKNSDTLCGAMAQSTATTLIQTNSIAAWFDESCIYDPGYEAQVGLARRDKDPSSSTLYLDSDRLLYASYKEYCEGVGLKAVAQNRFTKDLVDLCQNQLKLKDVCQYSHPSKRSSYIKGIMLRGNDCQSPKPISDKEVDVSAHSYSL
ncbi:MAG: phage/plasmid primase, P4 family [Elainellaceae cyanobacterium]